MAAWVGGPAPLDGRLTDGQRIGDQRRPVGRVVPEGVELCRLKWRAGATDAHVSALRTSSKVE